jgi:hypothetical protein
MYPSELDHNPRIEDDAPAGLPPDQLHLCGLTPLQVHMSTRNLFFRHQDMLHSCFSQLTSDSADHSAFRRNLLLLERGKEWLLEPLRGLQPRSFQAITTGGAELWSGFQMYEAGFPIDDLMINPDSYLFVNDRAYHINPYNPGQSPSEGVTSAWLEPALPHVFLDAWLSRVSGWQFLRQVPGPGLPHAGPLWHPAIWTTIERQLDLYGKGIKKKYLKRLKDFFGEEGWQDENGTNQFTCFINTRVPDGFSKQGTADPLAGDQFFVHLGRTDRVVYHIHQGDLETLRTIPADDVAHAFDGYFAHVFSRAPGEYDFMPYSRVLAKI